MPVEKEELSFDPDDLGQAISTVNIDALKEYCALDRQRVAAEALVKVIKDKMADLELPLIENLIQAGVPKIGIGNGKAIKIQEMIFAKINSRAAATKALEAAGLGDLIEQKYDQRRVSSYIREVLARGENLPPSFDGIIEASPRYYLKIVKG